jgi:EmrB/QacA subfamily drug resistance transporter
MSITLAQDANAASGRRRLALWTILAAQLMLQMDFLIVIVALPRMQQDLDFSPATLSWVPNAYGLAFGGLLLLGGRLGDMIGQVRAFRAGLIVFVLASLFGGLAQSPGLLIAARVLQGIGAALAGPSVLALVMVMARDESERARGMSLFIAVSSIGASAGLILGGLLTEFLSWRWALLINVPVGFAVIAAIGRLVEETRPKAAKLDIGGAVTATFGSVSIVYGFIHAAERGWGTVGSILPFFASVCLFATFLRIESKHLDPLLHLSLLRNRPRLAGLAVMALIVGMHFSVIFMLVQFLQRVLELSPLMAGLAYVPLNATVFLISPFIPKLVRRFGPRSLLISGSALVALSLIMFSTLDENSRYLEGVLVPLLVHALGVTLVFAPGTVAIMSGVPDVHASTASGLLQMDQQIGGVLGIAVVTAVYAMGASSERFTDGLATAFLAAAALSLVAGAIAWRTQSNSAQSEITTQGRLG